MIARQSLLIVLLAAEARSSLAYAPPLRPTGYFTDDAHLLNKVDAATLEAKLRAEESSTTNQVVVITLPSLEGKDISDVTYAIAQGWQVGQTGKDNGIVFAVAPNEHRMRIEVGKGLEGTLTDLETHIILDEIVRPHFKDGDFAGGIIAGTDAILKKLGGTEVSAPQPPEGNATLTGIIVSLIFFFLGPGIFVILGLMSLVSRVFPRWQALHDSTSDLWSSSSSSSHSGGGFSGGGGSFGGGGASSSW